jgi:hypothetical protein
MPADRPCATVRYGTPHISAKTVTENCVPMWVKKPSRVPGLSHTVLTLPTSSLRVAVFAGPARPDGVSLTTSSVSTIDSTPSAATEV